MGTTFVIIPKEEEAKNGLLQLVGELEFFFPDQVKVRDALALESGSTTMEAFLDMLAVQVDEKAIARAVEPEDVWAPISEIDTWQPLGDPNLPPEHFREPCVVMPVEESSERVSVADAIPAGAACIECGALLTGKKKKFCSKKCYMKDYWRRHPGKNHKNNGNGSSGVAEDNGSSGAVEETGLAMGQMTIDQLLEDEFDEDSPDHQVLQWRIMGSGIEVNDIAHLLDAGKLKLGELVRQKEGHTYQVTLNSNGDHVLRPV